MHQSIYGKHVRITDNVKRHISEKMLKIKHYSDKIIDASIICEHIHNDYIVEMTIIFSKKIFCIKHKDNDLYAAIDALFSKAEREIIKLKEKIQEHKVAEHKDTSSSKGDDVIHYDVEVETIYDKPVVDIVEAIMQCDSSEKPYFAYYPIKKTDDMYNVKISSTPVFLFKANKENDYIEIAKDEEEYYEDIWSKINLHITGNHVVETEKSEYDLMEHSASKAIEHLLLNKDEQYIVYISSITSNVECVYKYSDNKFRIVRAIDF